MTTERGVRRVISRKGNYLAPLGSFFNKELPSIQGWTKGMQGARRKVADRASGRQPDGLSAERRSEQVGTGPIRQGHLLRQLPVPTKRIRQLHLPRRPALGLEEQRAGHQDG